MFAAWAVFLALAWGPSASLAVDAAVRLAAGHPDAWSLLWPDERRTRLLARSAAMAAAVAALAGVLGGLAGLGAVRLLASRGMPEGLRLWLIAGLVLWLAAPPYLHALAGIEAGNWFRAQFLGITGGMPQLPGPVSVVVIQALALLPYPMFGALIGFATVERDLAEAGKVVAPPARVFRRIWLPLAAPALLAGTGAAFVFSLLDSSTPSLFGVPSYAMEIVAEYSATHMAWRAALLALPLILVAGVAIALVLTALRRTTSAHARARRADPEDCRPGPVAATAAFGGVAVMAIYGVMLLALLVAGAGLWRTLPTLVWETRGDLLRTIVNAALAAALVLFPAAAIAQTLAQPARSGAVRILAWAVVLLPLAIPPALTGAGLATLMAAHAPDALRMSPVIPAFAHAGRFVPLAVLIIHAQMRRVDPLLIDAARLVRPPGLARWAQIDLRLAAPGLIAAFGLVFCASMGELESTLMTVAPGAGVLSLRIFNYLHYGVTDTVAALGLALGLLLWAVALVALRLIRRQNRHKANPYDAPA